MPYRTTPLVNGQFYHVFNRGVEKREIFTNKREYVRFLESTAYYQKANPPTKFSRSTEDQRKSKSDKKIVEIIAYCLMPNHFHLLLQQLQDNGISTFIRKLTNSYTRYFNTKNERIGPLFQGQFKAVRVESDEQLLHLTRYIHLNPLVGYVVKDLRNFEWSSYLIYINQGNNQICQKNAIEKLISLKGYEQFVLDQIDYAKQLDQIKHLLMNCA